MILVHHAGVTEDGAAGIRGLRAFLQPIERLVPVEFDERGVAAGLVRTDPLDVLTVTGER